METPGALRRRVFSRHGRNALAGGCYSGLRDGVGNLSGAAAYEPVSWGEHLARLYTEVLRGTPVLLQLYFFWIGLPKLLPFSLSDTACILVALVVNSSSYISEIIRAGIGAVDQGQWEAARSLGLSEGHVLARVVLPQAVRNILPALGNQFIQMVKETSLASVFFVGELMTSYKTVQSATFLALQPLAIVGVIYLLMNVVLSRLVAQMERRLTVYG